MSRHYEVKGRQAIQGFREAAQQIVRSSLKHLVLEVEGSANELISSLHVQEGVEVLLNQSLFGALSSVNIPESPREIPHKHSGSRPSGSKVPEKRGGVKGVGKKRGKDGLSGVAESQAGRARKGSALHEDAGERSFSRRSGHKAGSTLHARVRAVERLLESSMHKGLPDPMENCSTGKGERGAEPAGQKPPRGMEKDGHLRAMREKEKKNSGTPDEASGLLKKLKSAIEFSSAPYLFPDEMESSLHLQGASFDSGAGGRCAGLSADIDRKTESAPDDSCSPVTIDSLVQRLWSSVPASPSSRVVKQRLDTPASGMQEGESSKLGPFSEEIQKLAGEGMKPLDNRGIQKPRVDRSVFSPPGPNRLSGSEQELADAVNRELVQQARRSGVEI